jgi:uncharacterized membrane protein YGL010W
MIPYHMCKYRKILKFSVFYTQLICLFGVLITHILSITRRCAKLTQKTVQTVVRFLLAKNIQV